MRPLFVSVQKITIDSYPIDSSSLLLEATPKIIDAQLIKCLHNIIKLIQFIFFIMYLLDFLSTKSSVDTKDHRLPF